nr:hypothetical protein [Clostridia bacterium]
KEVALYNTTTMLTNPLRHAAGVPPLPKGEALHEMKSLQTFLFSYLDVPYSRAFISKKMMLP